MLLLVDLAPPPDHTTDVMLFGYSFILNTFFEKHNVNQRVKKSKWELTLIVPRANWLVTSPYINCVISLLCFCR